MTFVHYGSDVFEPSRIKPVKNYGAKPAPGTCLWGSPKYTLFGYEKWAKENYPEKTDFSKYFYFDFWAWAEVLRIDSVADYEKCPKAAMGDLHFELIAAFGYSAVWLTGKGLIEVMEMRDYEMYAAFYGWDCDSVAVLDLNSIFIKQR